MPDRIARHLRHWWVRHVRRWHGETCDDCGRRYFPVIWRAHDGDWADVAEMAPRAHLLCPTCFSLRYERLFGCLPIWRPAPDG